MAETTDRTAQPDSTGTSRVDETAGQLGAGGGGSNDVTSGGGAGSGTPDAETAMRLGEVVTRGDVDKDRERIFPETKNQDPEQQSRPGQNARE